MNVDPFIEAEKLQVPTSPRRAPARGLPVRLLRAAKNVPSRGTSPTPSSAKDPRGPRRVQWHLWVPAGAQGLLADQGVCVGKWQVRRLMRGPASKGAPKKRWRTTTVADPEAEAAKDLIQRHFGTLHRVDRRYVGDITYSAQLSFMCSRSGSSPCSRGFAKERQHIITDPRGRREVGHAAGTERGLGSGRSGG